MLLLIFTVFHPDDSDIRSLVFYSERLEASIDLLNYYVKLGYTILSAGLKELDGNEITLPIEVFDGEPMGDYILRLQEEWKKILNNRP
ncbi:hypothetical protein [Larkinella sp. C7]|uniref:hypothetical protein n=1 Tax=Larkinella sp. C7 TaxID=2576607 RepID=UPI0011112DC4|nr:hypothetical protein [Larkinella sp. C7]